MQHLHLCEVFSITCYMLLTVSVNSIDFCFLPIPFIIFALSSGARLLNFTPHFPTYIDFKMTQFFFHPTVTNEPSKLVFGLLFENQENSTPQPIYYVTSFLVSACVPFADKSVRPLWKLKTDWSLSKSIGCHKQRVNVGCFPVALPFRRRRRRAQDADEEKTLKPLARSQEYNISLETTTLIAGCCNSCSWCNA